eukprot:6214652-Pleurochrysis_carterae.AAC.2
MRFWKRRALGAREGRTELTIVSPPSLPCGACCFELALASAATPALISRLLSLTITASLLYDHGFSPLRSRLLSLSMPLLFSAQLPPLCSRRLVFSHTCRPLSRLLLTPSPAYAVYLPRRSCWCTSSAASSTT